jgi:glycosyltransferase involved in cell wall biosynthesis
MRQHKLFWGSSYDRGLDIILFMWPEILQKYPDAELHICYGWELFDKVTAGNPERQRWKQGVLNLLTQKGIFEHGRVGKEELAKIRKSCGIWAYPTYFAEINCITALEAQRDGLVPVTMNYAALKETVQSGVKIDWNIRELPTQSKYLEALLDMMGDKEKWERESKKGIEFAKNYSWNQISPKWVEEFEKPVNQPLISVVTITIRPGFWNIMAQNLSKSTYKNFEWVIVDDFKEDRTAIAQKYAKKYNLNIKYVRGDKVMGKYERRNGLARANNIGWKNSQGELLVYLQDFILIPENGIEKLVSLYQHHPKAILAPVDEYYYAKDPNRKNLEDWWDGDTNIIEKFSWRNVRIQYLGIRKSDNPMDFEMNYGAIPRKIMDDLNGFWEFFDNGLGYDNTELALRALERGYYVLIDDTNIATCINLWPFIAGQPENIVGRDRHLAPPYYLYLQKRMSQGLSPVRDEKLDASLNMQFEVPAKIKDEDCSEWINEHSEEIVKGWMK